MNPIRSLGEVRPSVTSSTQSADLPDDYFAPPLMRLRSDDRPPITPQTCKVKHCPICAWRLSGLLDHPEVPGRPAVRNQSTVAVGQEASRSGEVRETAFAYGIVPEITVTTGFTAVCEFTLDYSAFCPGCGARLSCRCGEHPDEPDADEAYTLGAQHGAADGPENRPTRRWLVDAGLDPDAYLDGYDDACRDWPLARHTPLWDVADERLDGLPF